MKCPKCQFDNPNGMKFCGECGTKLEKICPKCNFYNPPEFKFCGECGHDLRKPQEIPPEDEPVAKPSPEKILAKEIPPISSPMDGERKYVTALFSDMSGYTAMSEKLDPEEVKDITGRIFGEVSKIVNKYDGFIEKFIGDAVMALFGVPRAHEDDPVRAIRAATEIHHLVRTISPEFEEKIGKPLSMHTGINTGLVVTGEVNTEKGTHGVAGDTINVAARLSSLAEAHTVIVGLDTYRQAEGFFAFETLEPTRVKGKAEPIQIYRLLSAKERPGTTLRRHGLRADLIGRQVELAQLQEAVEKLKNGKSSIFFICGDTGTGKTRLVEEFRATLDVGTFQWLEGQAYAYSQNTPYFPLIDLLNHVFEIKEGDPPEKVKEKVEARIAYLMGEETDVIPYMGSLYSLSYPEIEAVSPEFWKSRLQEAIHKTLSEMAQREPTIICLEDLHWADPSFMDLLRFILSEFRDAALFLCIYRSPFAPFTGHELGGLGMPSQEFHLQELSPSEGQSMLESLLGSKNIPHEIRKFIQENVGGNPFYLEEVINTFIESGTLKSDNGTWILSKPITGSDMPTTIHGIISARLDHLEKESKRILQEASVIGRTFLYDILKRCTHLEEQLDRRLTRLEHSDLIHPRTLQPVLEYSFKSALTHDVVYNGLLKKERQTIHDRIGVVMEQLFQDRLPEFYETLAFHFKQGRSIHKAVYYLIKAGEKSLGRYAIEESHQYFKEAFDLISNKTDRTKEEDGLLVDLLNKWSLVFYYRGKFGDQLDLLSAHRELAESLDDKEKLGMFYAWLGFTLSFREKLKDSYLYLCKAIEVGENVENQQVTGYACMWLTWTCSELGLLDEAVKFGERALEIVRHFPADHYLFFKTLGGIAYTCSLSGDTARGINAGSELVNYGQKHSNVRSMALGYYVKGYVYLRRGDFPSAIECTRKALQTAKDPFYSQIARFNLGINLALNDQFKEAEEMLQEVLSYCTSCGCEILGSPTSGVLGLLSIANGRMSSGLKRLKEALTIFYEIDRKPIIATYEHILGQIYLNIVTKAAPISFTTAAKNVGFLLKNVPSAGKKAEDHFKKAIEVAREIRANTILGQTLLDLGFLYKARGKIDKAGECLNEAVQILEQCGSEIFLKQAKEELASQNP